MKLAILQQGERSLVQIRFPLGDQVGSDQKVKMVVPFSPQAANSLNGLKTLKTNVYLPQIQVSGLP